MDFTNEVVEMIGQPESSKLEYKSVLPPSRNIAQLISSFANTDGGYIILGVSDNFEINGLSEDFHANAITRKALDLLLPQPQISYQYVAYKGKKLYAIRVDKSDSLIAVEGKIYQRVNGIDCSDLQEFVNYLAKQKIGKLQKGSVKGFIADNAQIKNLNVIDDLKQNEVEKILQIRHLYSHRNGIVDEKFLQYFTGEFVLNVEHQMSTDEICDKLCYLAEIAHQIDSAAIAKYKLAPMNDR